MVAAALAAGPLASVATADETSLERVLVESATTPQQHAALAEYYDGKSAAASQQAEKHHWLGKHFSGGKQGQVVIMRKHCERIAALYEEQAKEFAMMADMQRELAK
jgi:hypothetical protein